MDDSNGMRLGFLVGQQAVADDDDRIAHLAKACCRAVHADHARAALTGNRGQVNYAAAKGALNSATKALALELASRGITVNAIAPGLIDAGMADGGFDPELIARVVPMKRAGRADEVAALVAFLASDDAGYISGQVVSINGGMI